MQPTTGRAIGEKLILAEWKVQDPNHLVSPGGLLQLDWNSGIDWKHVFGLADNDVCSIHDYSSNDRQITTPNVSAPAVKTRRDVPGV